MRRLAASLALASACAPDPAASSDHVDLFVADGIEVCAGELARTDAFIARVHDLWTGTPAGDLRLDIHVTADLHDTPCSPDSSGCYAASSLWLERQIVQDELTAASILLHRDGHSAPLFESGVPIAFAPFDPFGYAASQTADFEQSLLAATTPDAVDGGKLALFARYAIDRYGGPAVRDYLHALAPSDHRDLDHVRTAFADVFDEPLDVAWADFVGERRCPFTYRFCDPAEPIELPFEFDGIDCDDPATMGYSAPDLQQPMNHPFGPRRIFRFDNDATRTLTFDVAAQDLMVVDCGACPAELWRTFEPSTFELELPAGSYAFVAEGDEGEVHLSISTAP